MRSAPSVNYPVGRSRFRVAFLLLSWSIGWAALVVWRLEVPADGARQTFVGFVLLACGLTGGLSCWRAPRGELAWDGAAWRWSQSARSWEIRLEVACDLQRLLVLRVRGTEAQDVPVQWLWLEPDQDTQGWQALRRAVYFHAGQQAQSRAAPAKS